MGTAILTSVVVFEDMLVVGFLKKKARQHKVFPSDDEQKGDRCGNIVTDDIDHNLDPWCKGSSLVALHTVVIREGGELPNTT